MPNVLKKTLSLKQKTVSLIWSFHWFCQQAPLILPNANLIWDRCIVKSNTEAQIPWPRWAGAPASWPGGSWAVPVLGQCTQTGLNPFPHYLLERYWMCLPATLFCMTVARSVCPAPPQQEWRWESTLYFNSSKRIISLIGILISQELLTVPSY